MNTSVIAPVQTSFNVSSFEQYKAVDKGPVFIVASGNSAKDFPIKAFSNTPMITMNGAIAKFINSHVRPYFYLCTDRRFIVQQPELFNCAMRLSKNVVLCEDYDKHSFEPPSGKLFIARKAPDPSWRERLGRSDNILIRNNFGLSRRYRSLGFSKDLARGYFDARTIAYLAVQVAYHMGFSTVFLVGVDLNPAAGRFYEHNGMSISPSSLDGHFESRILPSFTLMSKRIVGEHFRVYNTSPHSRIPHSIIPYKSLNEVHALIHDAMGSGKLSTVG